MGNKFSPDGCKVGGFFDTYDYFRKPFPSSTMAGNTEVGTSFGFFASLLLYALVCMYGLARGCIWINRDRPLVSSFTLQNTREELLIHNLTDTNFTFAFGVRNYFDRKPRHSEQYVEF
jgi:hypothetical protein